MSKRAGDLTPDPGGSGAAKRGRRVGADAALDHLTGLVDRVTFMEVFEAELDEPRDGPAALLVVDLDRFRAINHAIGHFEGDRLLGMIARRLRSAMRLDDVVCRLGGDEFAVLLRGPVTSEEATTTAQRVVALAGEPMMLDDQPVTTSVSVGVSLSAAGSTMESLLREADAALYKAKTEGRNRLAVFDDELRASLEERSRLEGELRLAMSAGGLTLHYQPEVDLVTGAVLGVEALVRWPHPVHGLLSADRFVELAEDAGMVAELGAWVLREACHTLASWSQHPDLVMRVNVSAVQLDRTDLVAEVAGALEDSGLEASRLCLEITETAVMTDADRSMTVLAGLHDLGLQLAIDDFGTGFSSLAYLKRFPVQILKIDQSFVAELATDPDDTAILTAVLLLAKSLDLEVIAEGVETQSQRDVLISLGCSRAQGHFFAPAMETSSMEEWLSEQAQSTGAGG